MKKSIWSSTFLILIILGIVGTKFYYEDQIKAVSIENTKRIEITIPTGSSTKEIAEILEENKLIKNKRLFQIISKLEEKDGKLKAGNYILSNDMTLRRILEYLINGGILKETTTFTIPEGYELRQIADKLEKEGLINKERFLELVADVQLFSKDYEFLKVVPDQSTVEGYLFPETYEIYVGTTEEEIIRKMLNQFEKIYKKEIEGKEIRGSFDLNEIITLASIIEREGKVEEELAMISGVFYNRLENGKKLESCATIQYALGERKLKLSNEDTRIDSLYNTYVYKGLPPAPIASPGLKAIQAAVNPKQSDYLFFVLKKGGKGTHIFTTNYKDHLRAKNSN